MGETFQIGWITRVVSGEKPLGTEKKTSHKFDVHVVVNFLFQVIFVFPLFLDMVIYANEVETKEK